MGHIFISYSHKDTEYAHGLAKNLQSIGFGIWIDERLDYGSQWPREIQKQLDTCDAFILIMSPRSFASDWVQSELQRAKRKLKPIFPLLLDGDEPWLSVESTQFYDVRGGVYPDSRFYSALKRVVSSSGSAPKLQPSKKPVQVRPIAAPKTRFMTETLVTLIGAMATICAALLGNLSSIREFFGQQPDVIVTVTQSPIISISEVPGPLFAISDTPGSGLALTSAITETVIPTDTSTPSITPAQTNPATETFTPTDMVVSPSPPTQSILSTGSLPTTITDTAGAEMVLVPEGEFIMGYDIGDTTAKPKHAVYLDSFYIDKYEVTNALYKACVAAGGCSMPSNHTAYNNPQYADHPVIHVVWNQAKTFCAWRGGRLPTEAEWEKAARGTEERSYPWGEGIDCSLANYSGCLGDSDTTPVSNYEAGKSPYGVYNLGGNVSEWVSSLDKPYPYSPSDGREDLNVPGLRMLRGGNWNLNLMFLKTWYRNPADPMFPGNTDRIGFRCAKEANP